MLTFQKWAEIFNVHNLFPVYCLRFQMNTLTHIYYKYKISPAMQPHSKLYRSDPPNSTHKMLFFGN